MRGKAAGWALFLGCLLLLGFAATSSYSKTADLALISLRLLIVVVLSILVVWERLRRQPDPQKRGTQPNSDVTDTVLQRFRRWCYDEPKHPN